MTGNPDQELGPELRARLLADPSLILDDRDLMKALAVARETAAGDNVVDIRGRAMEALETRLDRLEAAHESVISAAYANQTGMNTIHRAVVSLLEPVDFAGFLENLESGVAPLLRVESLHLLMETGAEEVVPELEGPLRMVPEGTIARLLAGGRRSLRGEEIVLRRAIPDTRPYHGTPRAPIKSEALLPLDLGPGRWPALLLLGSTEGARFQPADGTDLLRFLSQVFRLVLIGWLRE